MLDAVYVHVFRIYLDKHVYVHVHVNVDGDADAYVYVHVYATYTYVYLHMYIICRCIRIHVDGVREHEQKCPSSLPPFDRHDEPGPGRGLAAGDWSEEGVFADCPDEDRRARPSKDTGGSMKREGTKQTANMVGSLLL